VRGVTFGVDEFPAVVLVRVAGFGVRGAEFIKVMSRDASER